MKATAYIKKESIFEKFKWIKNFLITGIIMHIILWFVIFAVNLVIWKIWELHVYLLIERIAIIIVILIGLFIWYVECYNSS